MNEKPENQPTMSRVGKVFRYCVAGGCLLLILLWHAEDPPVLDMTQMQVTEGVYQCILYTGGKYGPTGPHIVDGVTYYDRFSYFFGVHAPTPCFKELDGRKVRMYYLPQKKTNRNLSLEVIDLGSGRSFGISKEKMYALYQEEAESKWPFYLSKFGMLLLALRLTCWNWIANFYQKLMNSSHRRSLM